MILRRSSYCGEMAINDDSEPDFVNFSNDTNRVASLCPSVCPCLCFPWENWNRICNSVVVLHLNVEFEELSLVRACSEVTGNMHWIGFDRRSYSQPRIATRQWADSTDLLILSVTLGCSIPLCDDDCGIGGETIA